MRLSHAFVSAIGIVVLAAFQTAGADLPGTSANAAVNITGDNRPDQWCYRWENNHWWYWTPQNRWMVYYDQGGWVYPQAIGGHATGCGGASVATRRCAR